MSQGTKTRWTAEEWDKVAFELHKRLPAETHSHTLAGIGKDDVFAAMKKVLPEARHRVSMNMTQTRPILLETFKRLRKRLTQLEHERVEAAKKEEADNDHKTKNALEPLAQLLAKQMFDHLQPMIDGYIRQAVSNMIPAQAAAPAHKAAAAPRKIKVGVMGLLPIQAESVKAEFPEFQFEFVENTSRSEEVRGKMSHVDVVFGLTSKMSHNAENVLKKMPIWGQYRRVGGKGGTTAMKNAIKAWMANNLN